MNFIKVLRTTADTYNLKIIGGDLCQIQDRQFQAVMTIVGTATKPILRHAASINDFIYVTGELGGSILGKHYDFQPRLSEGQWLAENKLASAMVDVTDGIAKELYFLANESASLEINLKSIPIAQSAQLLAEKSSETHCKKHSAMARTMNCYSRSTIQFKAHSLKVIGSNSFLKHL